MDANPENPAVEATSDDTSNSVTGTPAVPLWLLASEECQEADPFSPRNVIRTHDGKMIVRCGHDPEHTLSA